MWRPEWLMRWLKRRAYLCHVSRCGVSLFYEAPGAKLGHLRWIDTVKIDGARPDDAELVKALEALFQRQAIAGQVSFVFDSYWCPVLQLEMPEPWFSRQEVARLGQHRLKRYFGPAAEHWRVVLDFRVGQTVATVHAMPSSIARLLTTLGAQHPGLRIPSAQSSLAYVSNQLTMMERLRSRRRAVVLEESDRTVVALCVGASVTALHPALPSLQALGSKAAQLDAATTWLSTFEPSVSERELLVCGFGPSDTSAGRDSNSRGLFPSMARQA